MWQDSIDALDSYIESVDDWCNEFVMKRRHDQLVAIEDFIRLNVNKGDVFYSNCGQGYIIGYTFMGIDSDGVVHLIEDLGLQHKNEQTMSVEKFYSIMKENVK